MTAHAKGVSGWMNRLVHVIWFGLWSASTLATLSAAEFPTAPSEAATIQSAAHASNGRGDRAIDPASYQPRTLSHDLKQRKRYSAPDCLEVARALEHLHGQGLIHRDLKPSNIIFIGGLPKLADIGLVAEADSTGSCVGTEGYLPPEGRGSPAGDVYSLGKVIYQMLTGLDLQQFPELPENFDESPDLGTFLAFKGKHEDIRRIGKMLNVGAVVEGSVRKYERRLRVTAQLVKVSDGFHLWSDRSDREFRDVFELQDDITRCILKALRGELHLEPDLPLVQPQTNNPAAYQLYLMGRECRSERGVGLEKALRYIELALLEDPDYALTLSQRNSLILATLSWAYALDGNKNRALELVEAACHDGEVWVPWLRTPLGLKYLGSSPTRRIPMLSVAEPQMRTLLGSRSSSSSIRSAIRERARGRRRGRFV